VRVPLSGLFRPAVRLRLTLLYGCLFFVAAAIMLLLLYGLLRREFRPPRGPDAGGPSTGQIAGGGRGPDGGGPSPANENDFRQRIFEVRRDERAGLLRRIPGLALIALLVTSLVAVVLGWVASGQMLRPLRQITRHARLASETTLSDRIALRGPPDELKELADTMDAMLARLQAAFESQRQFAANASHELRTPLAIIQAEADVALAAPDATPRERKLAVAVRSAAIRSERLVDGLLALSRSESSMRDSVQLDLADLAGDVAGELVGAADAGGVGLDLSLDRANVRGDRALLERLITNLLQNAIRYNRRGGWVSLTVGTEVAGGPPSATLRIENSGPVIDQAEIDDLFTPFRRGTAAIRERTAGFGLGLAIVRSVAVVHAGEVTAGPGRDGGLLVQVRLPLDRPMPIMAS